MRRAFVFRDGAWVDKASAPPLHAAAAAPMVRSDGMDPLRSMLDGRIYDSRSAYYGSLRRAGAEIVGDDRTALGRRPTFEPAGVGASLRQAMDQLESR